jgi:hypothetical protein
MENLYLPQLVIFAGTQKHCYVFRLHKIKKLNVSNSPLACFERAWQGTLDKTGHVLTRRLEPLCTRRTDNTREVKEMQGEQKQDK